MSSTAESSPLSQSSVGSKARRVSRRGQIWSNFTEEVDATGYATVICRECKQVFDFYSVSHVSYIFFGRFSVYKLTNILIDVLIRIQGETYVTISRCIGYLKATKKGILKAKDAVETKDLACVLGLLLDRRFSWMTEVLDTNFDSIYIMATAFDSNTVHLLSKEEEVGLNWTC